MSIITTKYVGNGIIFGADSQSLVISPSGLGKEVGIPDVGFQIGSSTAQLEGTLIALA